MSWVAVLLPWARVLLAVCVFVGVAVLSTSLARRVGTDLRDTQGRTSPPIVAIGLVANLVVLGVVLAMLAFLDGRPIASIGVMLTGRDVAVMVSGLVLLVVIAVGLLAVQHFRGVVRVRRGGPGGDTLGGLLLVAAVLAVVAVQEEVVFRGYVTLNLIRFGWPVALLASTLLFVAVHLIANRVTPTQVLRWTTFGVVLGLAYLLSGSIWVPTVLHFGIDLLNVVAFGIAGHYTAVTITPPLSERARALYGVLVSVAIAFLLWGAYGLNPTTAPERGGTPAGVESGG